MPVISMFYGIIISLYFLDNKPKLRDREGPLNFFPFLLCGFAPLREKGGLPQRREAAKEETNGKIFLLRNPG